MLIIVNNFIELIMQIPAILYGEYNFILRGPWLKDINPDIS